MGETARPLEVTPGPALGGRFEPPGDKSVTHRAFLLALLARGTSVIENANPGADCASSAACVERLGLAVRRTGATAWELAAPSAPCEPDAVLDCGNSGTTLRLLAGLLAPQPFLSVLAGDASLNRRPVGRVIAPLRAMGAELSARDSDRFPPLIVRGARLRPIEATLEVASAQVASAVLFAGLQTEGTTVVTLPGPARDHTERMLSGLGVALEIEPLAGGGRRVAVRGPFRPAGFRVRVPGDLSAAAFPLAAAAASPGATVTAIGVGLNPTRTGFLDVLEAMGAKVTRSGERIEAGEPVGDVTVIGPATLRAFDIPPAWVPRLIDEIPVWAVVAARARGRSILSHAAELRVKESDRIATLAHNLRSLGATIEERPDGLAIEGGPIRGGRVEAHGDHRIAMAFAILGTLAEGVIEIDDGGPIDTSFPGFAATLRSLGARIGGGPLA